ncbi:MAG: uracil-DNA glycosylase [Anaerolineaceae bacterium]|nr:uracil-DNA glycosylase [Anaerolineaceae bacterium]
MESTQLLIDIRERVSICEQCKLYSSRKKAVPGEGPPDAIIMFIGEAPGFHENEQGKPFVGQAGKLLNELLAAAGLNRENVFITNVVKCRPPANRDPEIDELTACKGFLDEQIKIINPAVIVTLGRFSMGNYFVNGKISRIHGQPELINGLLIVPMYHPAAALHQPNLKNVLLEDFQKLPGFIQKGLREINSQSEIRQGLTQNLKTDNDHNTENAQQLSLFG